MLSDNIISIKYEFVLGSIGVGGPFNISEVQLTNK